MAVIDRILSKLDEHLHKNDYVSAEKHLLFWLSEAKNNVQAEILVRNELMGLYRKLGRRDDALAQVDAALLLIEKHKLHRQVGAATTYLNAATVYKAFSMFKKALPLYEQAKEIYEDNLKPTDPLLGGLYNNMGLALVDAKRFSEAKVLYEKAVTVMSQNEGNGPEVAITFLNMATAAEAEFGLEKAENLISAYLENAKLLLESHEKQDGNYAFVCEKCASVFGYYGHFLYAKELSERARRIYGQ